MPIWNVRGSALRTGSDSGLTVPHIPHHTGLTYEHNELCQRLSWPQPECTDLDLAGTTLWLLDIVDTNVTFPIKPEGFHDFTEYG